MKHHSSPITHHQFLEYLTACTKKNSEVSLIPRDLANYIQKILKEFP